MLTRATWHDVILAESTDCVVVEGHYYFPEESVRFDLLRPSPERTHCAWKGEAHYYDIQVNGETNSAAAWHYPTPDNRFERYARYISFRKGVEIRRISLETGTEYSRIRARHTKSRHASLLEAEVFRFLHEVPKTEIHLHMEAVASADSIYDLMIKNRLQLPGIQSRDDMHARFQVNSLAEFVDLYINVIQRCIVEEADFAYLVRDVHNYLLRNSIYYAEVFFSPSKFLKNGLSFARMIDILAREAQQAEEQDDIAIRFLVDVSRTYGVENAASNLDLVLRHPNPYVPGIGLGGAEEAGPARDFAEVFTRAKDAGLHRVAHAGEVIGPESIRDALHLLHAERIGHGISAQFDESLMAHLKTHSIPLEVCPTSNVFTRKYVHMLAEHPIRKFYDAGLHVTVNTDDPSVFGIELADEYMNLYTQCGFSLKEIIQLIYNNLRACFLTEEKKQFYARRLKESIEHLRNAAPEEIRAEIVLPADLA